MASQPLQTDEAKRLWGDVLAAVAIRLENPQTFETWFKPITATTLSPELVELEVPNPFFVDWIHEHHLPTLRLGFMDVLGVEPEIRLTALEVVAPVSALPPSPPSRGGVEVGSGGPGRSWLESQLNPRLTFANFVVGGSNQFTHAACRAVAATPGDAYNPLFIFGPSGLGKTHLLHAIGHAVKESRAHARVYYVSAERFTNEIIYGIQHAQTLAFRNKYRTVDVLLIDDIQFLAGKESTQTEFFHTFNALRDAHKQVVVTADTPPKDIPNLEDRLISRFNQGLVSDIKQPDIETRLAILRNRCEQEGDGIRLPDDVLLLIADRIRNNIRDLEGCLVRVIALASLLRQEVTLEMVEDVLQHYVNAEPERITPERIVSVVSDLFGSKPDALVGPRRTHQVALPRQVAMYLMRQLTDMPLAEIGRVFGGRDHTTVMYACDRVATRIAEDTAFADRINGLISTLASG